MLVDHLGQTIKNRRKELNVTQPHLAELAEISTNTLYKLERGQGNPSLEVLNKLAEVLGMELKLEVKASNKKLRTAEVFRNGILAGTLIEETHQQYVFRYNEPYFHDPNMPAISLTLPKNQQEYSSEILFPFFFNMLSEGVNRKLQCTQMRIDEEDNFGLLMATAQYDTIGAVTIKPISAK